MSLKVWYCRACQGLLCTEPKGVLERACRCEVPELPKHPTTVHLHPSVPVGGYSYAEVVRRLRAGPQADAEALAGDWQRVGDDLRRAIRTVAAEEGDPCPACGEADLEPQGGKHVCPSCGYVQPCCQP